MRGIGREARVRILELVRGKLGFSGACGVLGVSKASMSRYLKGVREVPDGVVESCLKLLTDEEVRRALTSVDRLRALGLVGEDGSVDYSLALEVIALASRDEYLKNAMLRFVVKEFGEDLRRMLGISLSGVRLEWSDDFERFMAERKRRRKVRTGETLKYYRSLFERYLEGRELNEQLIDFVVRHENKWLRNVFRHYIQYLFFRRRISPETFGWIMEVVPSRSYRLDVRPYKIQLEDVKRTFRLLRGEHQTYYIVYRVMLESGARLGHVLRMIESWSPGEVVEIPGVGVETRRLVRFEGRGFCRYYLGLGGPEKPCEWVYMSAETLRMLEGLAPRRISRHQVRHYAKRHDLVLPKYMRKVSWRLMVRAMPREVARFMQSRLGELRVSEARYEDLLGEADRSYPKYLKLIGEEVLGSA